MSDETSPQESTASQVAEVTVAATGTGNLIWPEIKKVAETRPIRYELCLVGAEISTRIEQNGGHLDSNLYKLTHLNFLEIAKTCLTTLPKQIGQIKNLTSLLCHTNELVRLFTPFLFPIFTH